MNCLARRRTTFGWIFFVLAAVLGRGHAPWLIAGTALAAVGEIFRTAAAGTVRKNQVLATAGPYAFCRHPLYAGSLLICLGLSVASVHPLVWSYSLILFPLSYIPAVLNEERALALRFPGEHRVYRTSTPLILPRPRCTSFSEFSWMQVWRNGEFVNWIALAGVSAVLWGKLLMRAQSFQ